MKALQCHLHLLPSSSSSSNPNFFTSKIPNFNLASFHIAPRCSSRELSSSPVLDQVAGDASFPVVRRPDREIYAGEEGPSPSPEASAIDAGLAEMARKMSMFSPGERVESDSPERPLIVNLDLALYRAKVLARNFRFAEAEQILKKCISNWAEDGRAYVLLGKTLSKQSKNLEARVVYEKGSQATQGDNPFIWQCWAIMESKLGNVRKARQLFDAATVADKGHIAAWHGWAILELKQGNSRKARNLLAKALKFCKGNEYVYQTLALLEAKASRFEQARLLFKQATKCNPRSCASWLAWAQMEVQQENNRVARQLFEKAIQASPKNRFAWHVWGVFETKVGNVETGRKLFKIGHALNPRDPVLLQSLALLEYKHSNANLARVLFRRASQLDPRHQPVWMAWGWMEWKEGNISTARELYQKALYIDSTSDTAARCLQAWGVLEHKLGNLSAARRLFRSSLNINSQSFITWMTWAAFEEDQGNSFRAEEIRNTYLQQRTEIVDDSSWVMSLLDMVDPTIGQVKNLFKLENSKETPEADSNETFTDNGVESGFNLDTFIAERLSLDARKLDIMLDTARTSSSKPRVYTRPIPSRR